MAYHAPDQALSVSSPSERKTAVLMEHDSPEVGYIPLQSAYSARQTLTSWQRSVIGAIAAIGLFGLWWFPHILLNLGYWFVWVTFMGNAVLRLWACSLPVLSANTVKPVDDALLPSYTVITALFREAHIVPQLIRNLQRIDYPAQKVEFLFVLEEIDEDTQLAFSMIDLPSNFRVLVVSEGYPRTKPRALNHALKQARGEFTVIYDAEDEPHPLQLREAAQLFSEASAELACVQAPLRPKGHQSFIGKHFSTEYAVHFDLFLPALFKAGISFPLGGTSNHFKTAVLRKLGGWDEYNVTEDADLGLRLAANGYQSGLINLPTIETPPSYAKTWIPQRTRWIKGHMQTLFVHTRFNQRFSGRAALALFLGVAISLFCAFANAPLTLMTLSYFIMNIIQLSENPEAQLSVVRLQDLVLFFTGWTSALICLRLGARRAGIKLRIWDIVSAPLYWMLHSVSACYAFSQLIMKPHHWDKTEHSLSTETANFASSLDEVAI